MSELEPKVITTKQAKAQINHFGRSLILYSVVFLTMRYVFAYVSESRENWFFGFNPEIIRMVLNIFLMLFITFIPFRISSKKLHLNIDDYLENPRLRIDRIIAFMCIGIGINLIVTSLSTLFHVIFQSESLQYSYLGSFSTAEDISLNILYFLLFVLIKPICDEYIFRGLIQRQLGHYGRYFGVLGSAFLYMIVQTNLTDAIPAFVTGWFLSLITLRYHSIRPAVSTHMAIAFFMWVINVMPGNLLWLISIFILLIYIIAGLFIFQKRVDTNMVRYGATEWKLWKILLTSSSIVICMILFVLNIVLSIVL